METVFQAPFTWISGRVAQKLFNFSSLFFFIASTIKYFKRANNNNTNPYYITTFLIIYNWNSYRGSRSMWSLIILLFDLFDHFGRVENSSLYVNKMFTLHSGDVICLILHIFGIIYLFTRHQSEHVYWIPFHCNLRLLK
jgi:hypothetical protein